MIAAQDRNAAILRAIERISVPERWTQRYLAVDRDGTPCPDSAPRAVRWCAMGALMLEDIKAPGRLVRINDDEGREAAIAFMRTMMTR